MLDRLIAKSAFASAITAALDEARRRGDRRLGTEHLLLGLLHGEEITHALGVRLDAARDALDRLDRAALAALGIDVNGLRLAAVAPPKGERLSLGALTSTARAAVNEVVQGTPVRRREPADLLRVLLARTHPDPVSDLLDELRVDRALVRRRLGG